MPASPASVLCVCTANVCRSPAAELLLRAGLRRRVGERGARTIEVTSAGIWASEGRPVEPSTAQALRAHGVTAADLAAVRSRPLRREAVVAADLVIGAAAEHVRGVWRLQIAARYRTFTLGELARLAEAVDPDLLPPAEPAATADTYRPADRATPAGCAEPADPRDPPRLAGFAALVAPTPLGHPAPVSPPRTSGVDGDSAAGLAGRLRALVRAANAVREARRAPDAPYVTEAFDLADPSDNDLAQRDMVEETAFHVDILLDLLAGPAPVRRPARDRVHWPAWAVQWSRSRARRGAPR